MIWAAQSGLLQVRVFCLLNSYSFFRFSIHSSYIDSKNILMQGLLATYLICESIGKKEASYMQISTERNSTGLTPSQLEQLCQPEQLERTLYLFFNMNHWAKAREQLFFVDRQGLYAVKAALYDKPMRLALSKLPPTSTEHPVSGKTLLSLSPQT